LQNIVLGIRARHEQCICMSSIFFLGYLYVAGLECLSVIRFFNLLFLR
jgi:hypothetical protein